MIQTSRAGTMAPKNHMEESTLPPQKILGWFLKGEVLYIDARKHGALVDRTRRELSDEDIAKISDAYLAWRGEAEARTERKSLATGVFNDIDWFVQYSKRFFYIAIFSKIISNIF